PRRPPAEIAATRRATSSSPGGLLPVFAFHAAAAPRCATRRLTASATPDDAAQLSASGHEVRRAAGLTGGSPPFTPRHAPRSARRVSAPAAAPAAIAVAFHS